MIDSAKRTSTLQVSLFMVICYSKFCCRRNSKYRLLNKANNRYEDILDIRSFVKVHINLSLLISMLLTKQQAFLFQHNRARLIKEKPQKTKSAKSSNPDLRKEQEMQPMDAQRAFSEALGHRKLGQLPPLPHCKRGDKSK